MSKLIGQRIEPTLALTLCTLIVAVGLAVPLGVLAAARAGGWVDRIVMAISVLGFSVPVFVIAYGLIFTFLVWLEWQRRAGQPQRQRRLRAVHPAHDPAEPRARPRVHGADRPRTRAMMLDVLSQDELRDRTAKGLAPGTVLVRHALKNAAVPIVTIIGIGVALLIGGVVVTETVFAIPGLGRLTVDAILRRDYPIIQGVTLLFSAVYVLVNLLVDLSYSLFDPRIRY